MTNKRLFGILALVFVATAIYHLFALFFNLNDSPFIRNLFWVPVNLFIAFGVYKRPSFFIYIFAVLVIQQFISHGSDLINTWVVFHRIDFISAFVLVYLPVIFILLILDRNGKLRVDSRL